MLALQLPSSMPHAVPSRQLLHTLPPLSSHPDYTEESVSPTSLPRVAASTSKPYISSFDRGLAQWQAGSLTPPGEMRRPYDGQEGVARPHNFNTQGDTAMVGRLAGYAGSTMPYPAPQMPHYPGSIPNSQRIDSSFQQLPAITASSSVVEPVAPPPTTKAVAPSLRIPHTIQVPQTSMPQLAAEVTCLFWFEDSVLLHKIEEANSTPQNVAPLAPLATPSIGFQKWATTIITTTQVTQNVVLLALLFIYRLKKNNPMVKGKDGSEFRLFTVALMLGNKFLDDNTYTNKTWADVSGISVKEVHLMEVEFLSNMRYGLFASASEWEEWHTKLSKFGSWVDKARKSLDLLDILSRPPTLPRSLHTGHALGLPAALPSPPVSNHPSPPYVSALSPHPPRIVNTPLLLPQVSSASVSPIGPLPELDFRHGRKRSWDGDAFEPPAKRSSSSQSFVPMTLPSSMTSAHSIVNTPSAPPTLPRLPLPRLDTISNANNSYTPHHVPQLPMPGGRAMALVYPPTNQWSHPPTSNSVSAPSLPPVPNNNGYPDRSRSALSPLPLGSNNSSPTNVNFPTSQTQNQSVLSPSYFLQQRSSPYRPVRSVKTLLVPPPSGTIQQPALVAPEQMQYQPLWRPQERHVGHVPYMNHEAWPDSNQFHHWPATLPHPQANMGR